MRSKYSGLFQEISYSIGLLSLTGVLSISMNIILPLDSLFNMYVCTTVVLYLCHHVSFCVMLILVACEGTQCNCEYLCHHVCFIVLFLFIA